MNEENINLKLISLIDSIKNELFTINHEMKNCGYELKGIKEELKRMNHNKKND